MEEQIINPVKYDDWSWHYEGNFPADLPEDKAFNHIAVFLGWIIENHMGSEQFGSNERCAGKLEQFRKREIKAAELLDFCYDGKLLETDLNDEANAFTKEYYDDSYYKDLEKIFENSSHTSMYEEEDSWENYEKVKTILDKRLAEWKETQKK